MRGTESESNIQAANLSGVRRPIVLSGEPKSTQHLYRYACRGNYPTMYMTAEGKALKEQYEWEARAQWRGKPLEGDVAVQVTFYFGTKRKADLDNFNKLWQDALSGIAYADDSQIAELYLSRAYDKANPRIELAVADTKKPGRSRAPLFAL